MNIYSHTLHDKCIEAEDELERMRLDMEEREYHEQVEAPAEIDWLKMFGTISGRLPDGTYAALALPKNPLTK